MVITRTRDLDATNNEIAVRVSSRMLGSLRDLVVLGTQVLDVHYVAVMMIIENLLLVQSGRTGMIRRRRVRQR